MKLKNKKLIIFDFDGTIIDSGPDLAASVNYMLKTIGKKTFDLETIHEWVGNGAQTLVKRALSGSKELNDYIDDTLFENSLEIFLKNYKENLCVNTVMYPYVKETLDALKEQGYVMAIVTNKPYAFIEPILNKLEIEAYFNYYIGGDSLSKKKPDPFPILHVCSELNVSIDESVMIGDSKNDILAANSADMQSIGVTYGYNYGEDINIYAPTVVVDNFKDILAVMDNGR